MAQNSLYTCDNMHDKPCNLLCHLEFRFLNSFSCLTNSSRKKNLLEEYGVYGRLCFIKIF